MSPFEFGVISVALAIIAVTNVFILNTLKELLKEVRKGKQHELFYLRSSFWTYKLSCF